MAKTQYVGKAGQLAIMGELAFRGYNVAIPEMDVGDDVFVVNDDTAQLWRLQVKTSQPTQQSASVVYQFSLRKDQLTSASSNIDLTYVFVMRSLASKTSWWNYVIIPRPALDALYKQQGFQSDGDKMNVRLVVNDDETVKWKVTDLSKYYNNVDEIFPAI